MAHPAPGAGLPVSALVALTAAFLPASIAASGAGGTIFYLLTIAGAAVLALAPRSARDALGRHPALLSILVLAISANLSALVLHDLPAREFSLLPLACVPAVLLAVTRGHLPANGLFIGGAAGGLAAFAVTLAEWPRLEQDPTIGTLNAIVFAQLTLVCVAFALAGAPVTGSHRRRRILLTGAALGAISLVASGTRGAILALPALIGVLWPHRHRWHEAGRAARIRMLGGTVALVLAILVTAWHSGLGTRLARIGEEASAFRSGQVGERSVAIRLALWRASLEIAAEHPLTGVGPGRFRTHLERLQTRGDYPGTAKLYSHPHNTPLAVLVQYGLGGLLLLIGATVVGWRSLADAPPEVRGLGRTLLVVWWTMGLSNDVLAHQNTLRAIAFCWAMLAGLACTARDQAR